MELTPELHQRIVGLMYAAAFSDILDELGFTQQAISPELQIRPLDPNAVIFGRACTLLNDFDANPVEPYSMAIEAMEQMQPGQVLVAAGRALLPSGIFGELSATRVRKLGGTGAIVNGFTRDGRKLLNMDFPVFCRGISPIDTTGRVRVVDYNVPLQFGDRTVLPNQLVFADFDGMVLIPQEAEDEVIGRALERVMVESQVRNELQDGKSLEEVWNKYKVL